ncbi:MAG: SRPBCC domain-containing protein [Candidatus Thermoplasmatota archaeon]|nr:SRPBCC domain-containing protein [Candidatus Thermoplasmatota archaeon]
MTTTQPKMTDTSLTVERTIQAPIERVFRAFTDPEEIAKWYHPGPMTTEVTTWEAQEGGAFDITMIASPEMELEEGDPGRYRTTGTFREVQPNERLVHTWRWEGMDDEESLVTVELEAVEEGTHVTLTHTKLADRESVESHAEGWGSCLENLAQHV